MKRKFFDSDDEEDEEEINLVPEYSKNLYNEENDSNEEEKFDSNKNSRFYLEQLKLNGFQKKNNKCYKCSKENHKQINCPEVICNNCSSFGHKSNNCKLKFDKKCEWCLKKGHTEVL
jgi:hypothetical protein